jgi:5-methyltetrahydrofolate--homocysteine methyltransferase
MKPILDRLRAGEILLGDGAIGSMLIAHGLQPGQCPDLLTLEEPDVLAAIGRQYLEAGAELLTTNTFGASPLKLADYGLEDKTEEINREAATILRGVAGDRAYVSASCGPSGRILEPYGDTSEEELFTSFERQMSALGEADVICVETMSDLREAALAVRAAKSVLPDKPVLATMTFDQTPRGFFTIMGTSVADAAAGLRDAGADVVGSNCGNGLEKMILIAAEFRAATPAPVLIQSNAGQPVLEKGTVRYPEGPEFFAARTAELIAAGASIIGGCCGTTPDHIRAVRVSMQ